MSILVLNQRPTTYSATPQSNDPSVNVITHFAAVTPKAVISENTTAGGIIRRPITTNAAIWLTNAKHPLLRCLGEQVCSDRREAQGGHHRDDVSDGQLAEDGGSDQKGGESQQHPAAAHSRKQDRQGLLPRASERWRWRCSSPTSAVEEMPGGRTKTRRLFFPTQTDSTPQAVQPKRTIAGAVRVMAGVLRMTSSWAEPTRSDAALMPRKTTPPVHTIRIPRITYVEPQFLGSNRRNG